MDFLAVSSTYLSAGPAGSLQCSSTRPCSIDFRRNEVAASKCAGNDMPIYSNTQQIGLIAGTKAIWRLQLNQDPLYGVYLNM